MRKWLIPLVLLANPALAQEHQQTHQTDADPCLVEGACRTVEQLQIVGPDGEAHIVDLGITIPWLRQGNIMLTPGESVTVSLHEYEGVLIPILMHTGKVSRDTPVEAGQVRFDLAGYERGRLILQVLSQYPEPIDYGALKVTMGIGPERTSVCTLMPGVASFEIWQEPIYQMALWGFRPAEDTGCKIIEDTAELATD